MDLGTLDQGSEVVKGRTDVGRHQKCISLEMKPGVLDRSPRQKIFTHDWLVPLSKSRRERESVTRRLRARVAAEPWKCEFLWRLDRERSRLLPQRASGIGQDFRGFVFKGSWCKGGGE